MMINTAVLVLNRNYQPVHVTTVNDFLAQRDGEYTSPICGALDPLESTI